MLSAAAVLGVTLWRAGPIPRWLALLFTTALPLSIAVMFVNMELAVQVPMVGGLSILAGGFVFRVFNHSSPAAGSDGLPDPA